MRGKITKISNVKVVTRRLKNIRLLSGNTVSAISIELYCDDTKDYKQIIYPL